MVTAQLTTLCGCTKTILVPEPAPMDIDVAIMAIEPTVNLDGPEAESVIRTRRFRIVRMHPAEYREVPEP